MDILIYLSLLVLAVVLFIKEIYPIEISALIILVLLVLSGILSADEALASFGNPSLFLIASLFVLTAGLRQTGIVNSVETAIIRAGGKNRNLSFFIVIILVAFLSAFISNTATLAVMIPVIASISRSFGESPKMWLLPAAFASILGGMNTLIGTSTNIIISSILPDYGIEPFYLFTPGRVGIFIVICGVVYLFLFSRYLISKDDEEKLLKGVGLKYDLRSYTAQVSVQGTSPLCGTKIEDANLFKELDVIILSVKREEGIVLSPRGGVVIREKDVLTLEGNINRLTELKDKYGLKFIEEEKQQRNGNSSVERDERNLKGKEKPFELHEVIITRKSFFNNRTPAEVSLRRRYNISLVAVHRQGETIREELRHVRMTVGDILVVQFLQEPTNRLMEFLGLVALHELKQQSFKSHLAPHAAVIFVLSLFFGSVSGIPIALCCLAGALLMVMIGVVGSQDVYEQIEWKVLIFIGAVLCLGKGMESSGTAAYIGNMLTAFFAGYSPSYIMAFLVLFTAILTQIISNQAAAIILVPIAVNLAVNTGTNPMSFIMAVTIGASCSFMTPIEPVCMLVYGPGGYKFSDFLRAGSFLIALVVVISIYVIPVIWPLG